MKKNLLLTFLIATLIFGGGTKLFAQKTLPYSYGFEFTGTYSAVNAAAALSTEGWTLTNASNNTYIRQYMYNNGHSFCFFVDESKDYQYLVSPLLSGASSLNIQFYWRTNSSTTVKYKIGYSTSDTPNVETNFTWSDTHTATWYSTYTLASESFSAEGIKYIAIQFDRNSETSTSCYFAIDDITISIVPPKNLVASPIMTNLATLSWTAGASESSWLLYYSTTNTAPTDYTTDVIPVNTNPTYTTTGLTKDATYYAWVCAKDNGIYSAWGGPVEFTPTDEFTLTVNNGTSTNSSAPLYGSGAANGTKSQFMVPATMLSNMANTQITKLEFYGAAANKSFGSAEYNIYMAETTASKFETASFENWESMSLVYNGSLSTDGNKMMTIDLTTPYIYSGGNLIIGCCSSAYGTNSFISWYGVNNSNDAYLTLSCTANSSHVYNAESYVAFSPKITFTFQFITFDNCNWGTGATTTAAQNVELKNNVTVANGTNAIANIIEMASESTFTIESGATLACNNIVGSPTSNLIIEDGGQLICNSAVQATLKKNIAGHNTSKGDTDGWYFIATPVAAGTTPSTSNGILTETPENYDLYYYHEPSYWWRNYKSATGNADAGFASDGGKLVNGKGYLYANANNAELLFEGATRAANAEVSIPLSFTSTLPSYLSGFNLVGNPFTYALTSGVKIGDANLSTYYKIDGLQVVATTISANPINPNTGFMVYANAENTYLVFNPGSRGETASKPSFIQIEAGNGDFMDAAYIQFGNVNTLRKYTLNNATPQVYVINEGADWAATVINELTAEIPVHFKAAADGQYTINVGTENVEMGYLHLIDNQTKADVDLMVTPSYSFTAKAGDNANRFRLVFNATGVDENETENEQFAFISNGNLIVNGNGTVQVIDVMGRIISTHRTEERISTSGMTPGVYVLRLIGNETRTQKIVIE